MTTVPANVEQNVPPASSAEIPSTSALAQAYSYTTAAMPPGSTSTYSATCVEVPQCTNFGDTEDVAIGKCIDDVCGILGEMLRCGEIPPKPGTKPGDTIIESKPAATEPLSTGAPKIPTAAPRTQEELADMWRQVVDARRRLAEREAEELEIAEEHKDAKKATEAAQNDLNKLIDELERPTTGELFRAHEQAKRESEAAMNDYGASADEQARMDAEDNKDADGKPKADPDGWKVVPLATLVEKHGMQNRAHEAFFKAGIHTLGDLVKAQEQGELSVKGLSPGGSPMDSVNRAFVKFWTANPQWANPKAN